MGRQRSKLAFGYTNGGTYATTGLREQSIEAETVHHQRRMGSDGIVSMNSGPPTKNKDKHSDSRIDNLDASPNSSVDLFQETMYS